VLSAGKTPTPPCPVLSPVIADNGRNNRYPSATPQASRALKYLQQAGLNDAVGFQLRQPRLVEAHPLAEDFGVVLAQ
jgi:hypothetical protein